MRSLTILVAFLLSYSLNGQNSFEIDVLNGQTIMRTSDGGRVIFAETDNTYPSGPVFTLENEEGHKYVNISELGGIEYNLFESKRRTSLNTIGLQLFEVDGQNANPSAILDITHTGGFRAFNDQGQTTVQIRGDVSGDGRVSTNELEITGGSDLSEYFNVDDTNQSVLPGMLISISDTDDDMQITSEAYDKKVVGVVSGANGIETGLMMGQKGTIADGETPIALVGRTYVYATTENGIIEKGDFLTSASKKGHAMKVKRHKKARGAIIGKALTSLEEDEGFVLVLINLQ